jgi:hypothetical protein
MNALSRGDGEEREGDGRPNSCWNAALFERRPTMKHLTATAFALFLATSSAFAAAPKTYQVTGPVLEVSDDVIVVQKGKEKWEIARSKDTKVTGELKVGAKVTIEYRMTAATVEAKGGGAEKAEKAEKPAKPAK